MPITVQEFCDHYILKNTIFEITIDNMGFLSKWGVKNFSENILKEDSFGIKLNCELKDPYITAQSVSVKIEYSSCFGEVKRIFTMREKALIVDDLILAEKTIELNYTLTLNFRKLFDYFMLSNHKFDIGKKVNREAQDLLLVNEQKNTYLGAIFKETMLLSSEVFEGSTKFNLSHFIPIKAKELFLLSYTFSLV